VSLFGRTIARLAQPFDGGGGPSHGQIERIWTAEDASEYLPGGNKMEKVLGGLKTLRDGRRASPEGPLLPPDHRKLRAVASQLAELLIATGQAAEKDVAEALDAGDSPPGRASATDASSSGAVHTGGAAAPRGEPAAGPRPQRAADPTKVMVVHGQDEAARRAVFNWLRAIGLRPLEWTQLVQAAGVASPYIGDVLDRAFSEAQAVVVLFTPDEHVRVRHALAADAAWRLQARPNVLLEAGMAFARYPEQTVLAVLGDQDLPTDLTGRHYVRLGTAGALRDLAQRLEGAGCPVDITGSDWLDPAVFPDRWSLPSVPPSRD